VLPIVVHKIFLSYTHCAVQPPSTGREMPVI